MKLLITEFVQLSRSANRKQTGRNSEIPITKKYPKMTNVFGYSNALNCARLCSSRFKLHNCANIFFHGDHLERKNKVGLYRRHKDRIAVLIENSDYTWIILIFLLCNNIGIGLEVICLLFIFIYWNSSSKIGLISYFLKILFGKLEFNRRNLEFH